MCFPALPYRWVGPYTYSLDGNTYQASNLFTGLAPGYYPGYVKDSKTCIVQWVDIFIAPDCEVRSASRIAKNISTTESFTVKAFPNPTATSFTLQLQGMSNEKVVVIVTDIMGRKVYQFEGNANLQYRFGSDFKAGMYNVQVIQGNKKSGIKLIKE